MERHHILFFFHVLFAKNKWRRIRFLIQAVLKPPHPLNDAWYRANQALEFGLCCCQIPASDSAFRSLPLLSLHPDETREFEERHRRIFLLHHVEHQVDAERVTRHVAALNDIDVVFLGFF